MEKKEKTVSFALTRLITDQFAINENAFSESTDIQFGVGIQFGIDEGNNGISCSTNFRFVINDIPFIQLKVSCEFRIEDIAWVKFIDNESCKINFPRGFMSHLAMITVGTARGVLHTKTENTKFNIYIIPPINLNDHVENDISFDLENRLSLKG